MKIQILFTLNKFAISCLAILGIITQLSLKVLIMLNWLSKHIWGYCCLSHWKQTPPPAHSPRPVRPYTKVRTSTGWESIFNLRLDPAVFALLKLAGLIIELNYSFPEDVMVNPISRTSLFWKFTTRPITFATFFFCFLNCFLLLGLHRQHMQRLVALLSCPIQLTLIFEKYRLKSQDLGKLFFWQLTICD